MIIIRTHSKETKRKRYEPKPIWWKNMTKAQQESYIIALDHLDKAALKK
jgi:hypothetical protein